jgi:superfamily II DNA or RNA helicase
MFIAADAALSGFFERGGLMKIVCSPRMLPEDVEAISQGIQSRLIVSDSIERDLKMALESEQDSSAVRILGLLVELGQIEFKIAVKRDSAAGIFHSKVGIFRDNNGQRSAFCGSTNETWSGWADYGNSESFISMNTYSGVESQEYVDALDSYFDSLWSDSLSNLSIRPLPEVPREILIKESKGYNLEELIDDLKKVKNLTSAGGSQSSKRKQLMEHQSAVLKSWKENGYTGIIDHVTGAGKTVTALSAAATWIKNDKPVLIIVPSTLLQKQWGIEIRSEIGVEPLFVGGNLGNRSRWLGVLADATRKDPIFGKRITVAVLGTASTEDFLKRVQFGEHLLVVGDEVHTIGQMQANELSTRITRCGGRLGLSATYQRFGDMDGTKRIEKAFGLPLLPKFTIRDAIDSGRLVPYEYRITECLLEHDEQERFDAVTKEIHQLMAREKSNSFGDFPPYLQMLIFRRAKIVKQANAKTALARKVLLENYKDGDRWLVYCDDIKQVESISSAIDSLNLPVTKYFDAMTGDKNSTLDFFGQQGGVLLAIKCLDEGIDIPSATHALILASSQNPREYIQRRGRVLRSNPSTGKYKAVIYDVVTLKSDDTPVMRNEIERMASFAADADNSLVLLEIEEYLSTIAINDGILTEVNFEEPLAEDKEKD